eukprot:TRINITY_DN6455_c0_g2_i1.p1 TRINITY_DN6455_c0_g2~~TRINITY_DN6455_c0_g2_i1.p1  ORF type:complete len:198 (-),score=45.20 TRINITY_DN6455_c0_g2_i1:91-684(-)
MSSTQRYRIMFYGGNSHTSQILASVINSFTNQPVEDGTFQWMRRNTDKTFSPIKAATTRCYAPNADDLYTVLRLEYTSSDGKVILADVPPQFFKMDPSVEANVSKYVEMGRSTGISFSVLNAGAPNKTGQWTLVVYNNLVQVRHDGNVVSSHDGTTKVLLSPTDPTIFRVADNYFQTTDLKTRDEIVLTIRALLGSL